MKTVSFSCEDTFTRIVASTSADALRGALTTRTSVRLADSSTPKLLTSDVSTEASQYDGTDSVTTVILNESTALPLLVTLKE